MKGEGKNQWFFRRSMVKKRGNPGVLRINTQYETAVSKKAQFGKCDFSQLTFRASCIIVKISYELYSSAKVRERDKVC